MSTQYAQEWPVPGPADQPPKRSLPTRRVDAREYQCGLIFNPPADTSALRSYSLLPAGFHGKFDLDASKAHFGDARFDADDTWIRVRVDVPFRDVLVDARQRPQYEDHPLPTLRPSERGPILTVRHSLEIALTCAYDLPSESSSASSSPGSARALDELKFTIPLTFVRVPRSGPHCPRVEPFAVAADAGGPLSATGPAGEVRLQAERVRSQPYAQPVALPAYNTLYHRNGVLREDPTPLPVYTKDGGREHPLAAIRRGGQEFAGEQRVDGAEADEERPAMTICKQTPLHKVAASARS